MEKKKTKLTLSGNLKKSISNIEKAKTQGKNSVFIDKKSNKFVSKKNIYLYNIFILFSVCIISNQTKSKLFIFYLR